MLREEEESTTEQFELSKHPTIIIMQSQKKGYADICSSRIFYFFFPKKCLIKQSTSMYISFKKVKYIVGKCKKNELQNDKWRLARLAAFVGI